MECGIKVNNWNNTVIIPTFSFGKLNNLYKVEDRQVMDENGNVKTKLTVMCTPGMEHTLMLLPDSFCDEIWLLEGHWDPICALSIVSSHEITPLGIPGCGVWKPKWTDYLSNKNVVFCYDNDQAGRNGIDMVIQKYINNHPSPPRSVSVIDWTGKPDKYDVNDAYKEYGRSTYSELRNRIKTYSGGSPIKLAKPVLEEVKADESIDTYPKLLEVFKGAYHVTQDIEYGLILALASIYGIHIGEEQLWFRFIGPPGCGKTTVGTAICASARGVLRSKVTGLFSGWKDDSEEDASVAHTINGKLLVIKDADPLFQQGNIAEILSEFRDLYDKNSTVQYKNRVKRNYRDIRTSIILCGTRALRKSDDTFLGERFLDFEMKISATDERIILDKIDERSEMLMLNPGMVNPETTVQQAMKGFIDHHLCERKIETPLSQEQRTKCRQLAKLAAQMRTSVDRDMYGKGEATFTPVVEVPGRLFGQLKKMCYCTNVVMGDEDKTNDILHRVVRDIIDPTSKRYSLASIMLEGWYNFEKLQERTKMQKSTLMREMDNLRLLRLVDEKDAMGSKPGYRVKEFTLTDEIKMGFSVLHDCR
jgi:hypothetical protein